MIKRYRTESKIISRRKSIIEPSMKILGGPLKEPYQYWSMCSYCEGSNSELNQLVESGLIKPNQFHGVDKDQNVYDANKKLNTEANFYCNDIYKQMRDMKNAKAFKPGIVNLDTTSMGEKAARLTSKIIELLMFEDGDVKKEGDLPLLFVNTVLSAYFTQGCVTDFWKSLFEQDSCRMVCNYIDLKVASLYKYRNGRTSMNTYLVYA